MSVAASGISLELIRVSFSSLGKYSVILIKLQVLSFSMSSFGLMSVFISSFKSNCRQEIFLPEHMHFSWQRFVCLFVYLGFYVAFNTVQVISRRVVGRAEETSTYSSLGFCTVNCRPTASNYQLSHLRP